MFYTATPPASQGDRVRLFPTPGAARSQVTGDRAIHAVAVALDAGGRALVPDWKRVPGIDATWRTPAELHQDGSVTARGPIPAQLFVH